MKQSRLKQLFRYDQEGFFVRRVRTGPTTFVGQKVRGTLHHTGYVVLKVDNRQFRMHRLIFLFHNGFLPKHIDHKDRNRANNKIENLRESNSYHNAHNTKVFKNNTSGFRGVFWEENEKKWAARIKIKGVRKRLGYFSCPVEASKVYEKKKAEALRSL